MDTIELINGNPILEMDTFMSSGEMVPCCISYNKSECQGIRSNYNLYNEKGNIKKVIFTKELKLRVLHDLLKIYEGDKLTSKLIEFNLINF